VRPCDTRGQRAALRYKGAACGPVIQGGSVRPCRRLAGGLSPEARRDSCHGDVEEGQEGQGQGQKTRGWSERRCGGPPGDSEGLPLREGQGLETRAGETRLGVQPADASCVVQYEGENEGMREKEGGERGEREERWRREKGMMEGGAGKEGRGRPALPQCNMTPASLQYNTTTALLQCAIHTPAQ
jgi:hypothetical protein